MTTARYYARPSLLLLGCAVASAATPPARGAAAAALPQYPTLRFTQWDDLSHDFRNDARAAGYHEKSWNRPGDLAAEKLDYESLEPRVRSFVDNAHISAESWDCHVNHYRNYEWDELEEAQAGTAALGWTEDMWCGEERPEEEGKYWGELTEAQQEAAASVCYTQELWDEVAIPLWTEDDGAGGVVGEEHAADLYSQQETDVADEKQLIYEQMYGDDDKGMAFNGPASAHNARGVRVPLFRYDPWEWLHPDYRSIAERADYDEKSWNAIGTNRLEKMAWQPIGDKHPAMQQALAELGFYEESWDCYMSHYRTYDWGELKDIDVQQYYKEMGYSHNSWNQDISTEVEGMYWPSLNAAQQNAAYQLGYFRETWDEVSIQFWPRTTSNTASLKDYVQQHKAAVGGGSSTLLVALIVACACCYRAAVKKNKPAKGAQEYEMPGGKRFTD